MKYEIVRSNRRTVAISIKEGNVILRVPLNFKEIDGERIIKKHEKWILSKLEKYESRTQQRPTFTEEEIKKMKREARMYFKCKIDKYSEIMNLKYSRMKITSAKTRFGSCSSKGNICFSYFLMLYPESAREYVVVHELAHLVEMNHSRRFYEIVGRYMPDYKERRKQLKNGV